MPSAQQVSGLYKMASSLDLRVSRLNKYESATSNDTNKKSLFKDILRAEMDKINRKK